MAKILIECGVCHGGRKPLKFPEGGHCVCPFCKDTGKQKNLCRILRMLCLTGELKLDAHAKLNVITACENAPLVVKKN